MKNFSIISMVLCIIFYIFLALGSDTSNSELLLGGIILNGVLAIYNRIGEK